MSTPTPAPAQPLVGAAAAPAAQPAPEGPSAVDRAIAAVERLEAEHGPAFGGPEPAAPTAPKPATGEGGAAGRDPKGRFTKAEAGGEPAKSDTAEGEPGTEGDEPELDDDDDLEPAGAGGVDADPDDDLDDLEPAETGAEGEPGDEPAADPAAAAPVEVKRAQAAVKRERVQLERDKAAFGQEVAAVRGALIAAQSDLQALQRLRSKDPAEQAQAIDDLGIDAQELTLAYAQRGRPEAAQTKRERELAAALAEQKKALEQMQAAHAAQAEAADRKRFTRDCLRDTTYTRTAALAKANPDRLYELACARAQELIAKRVQPTPALLMRGVERRLRDLGVPRPGGAAVAPEPAATARAAAPRKQPPPKRPPAAGITAPPAPASSAAPTNLTPEQRLARAIDFANKFGA